MKPISIILSLVAFLSLLTSYAVDITFPTPLPQVGEPDKRLADRVAVGISKLNMCVDVSDPDNPVLKVGGITLAGGSISVNVSNTIPSVVVPYPATVEITDTNAAFQLSGSYSVRMINVYNTNSGQVFLMLSTNGGFRLPVNEGAVGQWVAPENMVIPQTNWWFTGATGVVHIVTWR